MTDLREIDRINSDIITSFEAPLEISSKPSIKKEVPQGLASIKDSISSAFNPGFFMISLQNDTEEITKQELTLSKKEVEDDVEELKKLNEEKIKALKEHAIKINNASTWETIKNVGSYFAFATSTLVGMTNANPIYATALVATGAVGLVNRVLSDTGVWKKIASYFVKEVESQESVSRYIDNGFTIATAGAGLFFAAGGVYFGVDALLAQNNWALLKNAGYFGSSLISAVSSYGETHTKSEVYKSESILTNIESKHTDLSNDLKFKSAIIEQTAKERSGILSQVYSTIKNLIDDLKKITER